MFWKRWSEDDGTASLEFITVGMLLTVPLVYLILALAQIQAGALAAEGAVRNAARTIAMHGEAGFESAETTTLLALADAGFDDTEAELTVDCGEVGCEQLGGTVTVTISFVVPLPLVPAVLDLDTALGIPIAATATQPVSEHITEAHP
ncbi:TadE family protein [uncultured Agrococcus sp.]|uniref:TadE family protein n=1 Tax=uncultured Agrococcus sp. TaxID=382258 RepID=UPI0025D2542E|nr:TadE family protein [uncultured Agrococcus sp.]